MACLHFRSVCLNRLLYNVSNSRTIIPGVFRISFCTYNVKSNSYVNLVTVRQKQTSLTLSSLQCSTVKHYSTEKPSSGSPETPKEEDEHEKRAKAWQRMKLSLIFMGCSIGFLFSWSFYVLGSPDQDEDGKDIDDEFINLPTVKQWCSRFYSRIRYYKKVIQEPSQEKLLPDPLQYPYLQPPYTLVIELNDVLVHPDWTYQTGWRFKKRPHVDAFLEQVSAPHFEIVIFTADQAYTMLPIVNQLNKNGLIPYTLFRDSTDFIDGHHVKNLNWLNRDLSKVIVLDWDDKSVKLHPDNALIVPRWRGDDDDHSLLELASLLKMIAFNKIDDVREVISYYKQYPDPLAKFRENQQILMEQMEEQERLEQAKKQNPPLTQRFAKSYMPR